MSVRSWPKFVVGVLVWGIFTLAQAAPTNTSMDELQTLAPFEDIAVIQKRFLPKTQRFEILMNGSYVINDAFFNSLGFGGRIGYYFTESWGIEGTLVIFGTSDKEVVTGMKKLLVETQSIVSPQTFYGVDIKYSPIYGKMGSTGNAITPFDLYFSAGLGLTTTSARFVEPTVHLGTGQIFAVNKDWAFRWDFSWNFYSARNTLTTTLSNQNNLFMSMGASFFFPEAGYR